MKSRIWTIAASCAIGALALVCATPAPAAEPKAPVADRATAVLLRFDEQPLKDAGVFEKRVRADGVALEDGRFGKALNGLKTDRCEVRIDEGLGSIEGFTVECWVRFDGPSDERLQRIVQKGGSFGLYFQGRRPMMTFYTYNDKHSWKSVNALLTEGEWTHVTGTFDGTTMRLYVNGQPVGEQENPGAITFSAVPMMVGGERGPGDAPFVHRLNGLVDEVRVSTVVRTDFMTGKPLPEPEATTKLTPVEGDVTDFRRNLSVIRAEQAPTVDGSPKDAVWRDAPQGVFRTLVDGKNPETPTVFQAAFDDESLYLVFNANEKGQESQVHGPKKRDDNAVWRKDAVEIFLQPEGEDTPYYHIVVNPAGGVYDARHADDKGDTDWNCQGLKVAGDILPDNWFVEVAIPFSALGETAPGVGGQWRANFARAERPSNEFTAWSETGGGFHVPNRFGTLNFVAEVAPERRQAGQAVHKLIGALVDESGEPQAEVLVETPLKNLRTDLFGKFVVEDINRDRLRIMIASPRYENVLGEAKLVKPVEILEPIVLKRVDPYLPLFKGPIGDGPVTWLASSIDEPPDMVNKPEPEQRSARLRLLATPGEFESRAVALFANQAVEPVAIRLDGLKGPGGSIPADAIDLRWTQRLLKRVQYRRMREDAIFTWRWLWREAPDRIEAGQVRQICVTVKVPDGAKAGVYGGDLVLESGGKTVASLPVELRVAGFTLTKPKKYVGVFFRDTVKGSTREKKTEEQLRRELKDFVDHGGRSLVWKGSLRWSKDRETGEITYDLSDVRQTVALEKETGIEPPYEVGPGVIQLARLTGLGWSEGPEFAAKVAADKAFAAKLTEGVKALDKLQAEMAPGGFYYAWMDEVIGRGRTEPWLETAKIVKAATKTPIWITLHNRDKEKHDLITPYIGIRCYHGHTLDSWLGEGHTWEELQADLDKYDAIATSYYNVRDYTVTSEYARLCNGYWLWRSCLEAHTPWGHYAYHGSAFDDLDHDNHDFGYTVPHPTKPEMISSLWWESHMEGYDDLRYLDTLEKAIARAEKAAANHPDVKAAKALIKAYWDADSRVPVQAEVLSAADYHQRREDTAAAIEKLQRLGK